MKKQQTAVKPDDVFWIPDLTNGLYKQVTITDINIKYALIGLNKLLQSNISANHAVDISKIMTHVVSHAVVDGHVSEVGV